MSAERKVVLRHSSPSTGDGYMCIGGPFHGSRIALATNGDGNTLVFTSGKWSGQYRSGQWTPTSQAL